MTPKLTEEEKERCGQTCNPVPHEIRSLLQKKLPETPEAVCILVNAKIIEAFARGRESGIREALEAVTDEEGERPFHGVDAILAARLARLLPAKEPTPEQRVEAILLRHKFRQDVCEYVAAEIVADLDRERS